MSHLIQTSYRNPIILEAWPDPAVAGPDRDGLYWCYATDDEKDPPPRRRFKVARSRDLVHWETHPEGARHGAFPRPIPNYSCHRGCWAPDVRQLQPDAWNFYGALEFDDHEDEGPNGHGIIAARSSGPIGFADPVVLRRGTGFTVIDPCFFHSTTLEQNFLYWGSGHAPIWGQELAADGLSLVPGTEPRAVLAPTPGDTEDRLWEGLFVFEHPEDRHVILLASKVDTWVGPYRTYAFRGGAHPLDRVAGSEARLLLGENAVWNRCGNVFVLPDAVGQLWLFYHAVRGDAVIPGTEGIEMMGRRGVPLRQACMDRLLFDTSGLPYVEHGVPSSDVRPGPIVWAP
ncbi:family 43 glycosylhydrolase [Roseococcus sp. SYP-B2431]|uniref:family 43 glycosylhydrolase n=1 Tax=Roseococcus sp. SYP-B2431 TaxID=2496640 RepID=UPI0013F4217A|nr:family 43 glycosylhydrolase [Roseococcus sp. SYP-B2431]